MLSCCGQADSRLLEFVFELDYLVFTYVIECMCTQFLLATNWTFGHVGTAVLLFRLLRIEKHDYEIQTGCLYRRLACCYHLSNWQVIKLAPPRQVINLAPPSQAINLAPQGRSLSWRPQGRPVIWRPQGRSLIWRPQGRPVIWRPKAGH
jgi:hypothetical protein